MRIKEANKNRRRVCTNPPTPLGVNRRVRSCPPPPVVLPLGSGNPGSGGEGEGEGGEGICQPVAPDPESLENLPCDAGAGKNAPEFQNERQKISKREPKRVSRASKRESKRMSGAVLDEK